MASGVGWARWYYQACAWLAPKLPVVLVSDAQVIARWYRQRYGKPTIYIPYGIGHDPAGSRGHARATSG